jgi:hypothetical protein
MIKKDQIPNFLDYLTNVAKGLGDDAGFSGAMNDGGQRALENEIFAYKCGQEGTIPLNWMEYIRDFKRLNDPEYTKYLELKKKFG